MISIGIWGSDDHAIKGVMPLKYPFTPGHEGAGTVESIGDRVSSVEPGGNGPQNLCTNSPPPKCISTFTGEISWFASKLFYLIIYHGSKYIQ